MKKRVISSVLVAVFMCAAIAPRASAEYTGPSYSKTGFALRSCTYANAPVPNPQNLDPGLCVPTKPYGAGVGLTMLCWKDDYGTRWFLVKMVDGTEGFVDEPHVDWQTRVSNCSWADAGINKNKVLAGDWALSTVNQITSSSTVAGHYPGVYWPAPYVWGGMCYVFAHYDWYTALGRDPIYAPGNGYAIDVWNQYKNEGKAYVYNRAPGVFNQPPPYGAMVFWSYVDSHGVNEGHVGIAVGGDRVVDTHTWVANYDSGAIRWENWNDYGREPNYLGWVPIEKADFRN